MSRFSKTRKIRSRKRKPSRGSEISIVNRKSAMEIVCLFLSALSSLIVVSVAIYVAFFSPLSDALQAQYKYQDIENTETIKSLNANIQKKTDEFQSATKLLTLTEQSLLSAENNLKQTQQKTLSIEAELKTYQVKVSDIKDEYIDLNNKISTMRLKHNDLKVLHNNILRLRSKEVIGATIRRGHFLLPVMMNRKHTLRYNDPNNRERDTVYHYDAEVDNVERFDAAYLWGEAAKNLEKIVVSSKDTEEYGQEIESIFGQVKLEFEQKCRTSFLNIDYITLPIKPTFEQESDNMELEDKLTILRKNFDKRSTYNSVVTEEAISYYKRVSSELSRCIEGL